MVLRSRVPQVVTAPPPSVGQGSDDQASGLEYLPPTLLLDTPHPIVGDETDGEPPAAQSSQGSSDTSALSFIIVDDRGSHAPPPPPAPAVIQQSTTTVTPSVPGPDQLGPLPAENNRSTDTNIPVQQTPVAEPWWRSIQSGFNPGLPPDNNHSSQPPLVAYPDQHHEPPLQDDSSLHEFQHDPDASMDLFSHDEESDPNQLPEATPMDTTQGDETETWVRSAPFLPFLPRPH